MVQFLIVNESLKIIDDTKTVVFIAKKDVFAISQSLYQAEPIADIYNLNLGYLGLVFTRKLSECLDPDGNVFTVDSFITFVETYLGFETGVIPQTITVVLNYNALPDPTTVSGEFYWCQQSVGAYPAGIYYSNGVSWEYTSGGGSGQSLQQVTEIGNATTTPITADSFIKTGSTSSEILAGDGSVITAGTNISITGGLISASNQLQNLQEVTDLGDTTTNPITADSFIKTGSTSSEILAGDGSVITAGSNISISEGKISAINGSSGGSSVYYYLNGGTASTAPTYYQMSNTVVIGSAVNFTRDGTGLITQWLTDVGNPNRLEIPAGTWDFEIYMSASSNGGTPAFYVQLLKYDGSTFTEISNSSATPEAINGGTTIDLYLTSLAIPQTTLLSTDRLALRFYIVNNVAGRVITMHTQDSHICQVITNFAGGITALNGLTATTQYFTTTTSGSAFSVTSSGETHRFNMPILKTVGGASLLGSGDVPLIYPVIETAVNYILSNSDNGLIIIFTTSATLTIPIGLPSGFECTFVTLSGATLTVPAVAGITLNNATNPTGSNIMLPQLSFTLKRMLATNTFIATGNL